MGHCQIFQRTRRQPYPRTRHQQGRQEEGNRRQSFHGVHSQEVEGQFCVAQDLPKGWSSRALSKRSQTWACGEEAAVLKLSHASVIQARIQVPLAFPDGLIVRVGNRWWPLLVLSSGSPTSCCCSRHRLALGFSVPAPVVYPQQQAQRDADVNYDDCDHCQQVHL